MATKIVDFKSEKAKLCKKRNEELFNELAKLEGLHFGHVQDKIDRICRELDYKRDGVWVRDPRNFDRLTASLRRNRLGQFIFVKEYLW